MSKMPKAQNIKKLSDAKGLLTTIKGQSLQNLLLNQDVKKNEQIMKDNLPFWMKGLM